MSQNSTIGFNNTLYPPGLTAKNSPLSADLVAYWDTAGLSLVQTTWTNIATLFGSGLITTGTVAAAGTTQATATVLTKTNTTVTSSTAGSAVGVALPTAAVNSVYIVNNFTANAINVYPVNGGSGLINALAVNAAYILSPYSSAAFAAVNTTQWYTVNEKNPVLADYYNNSGVSIGTSYATVASGWTKVTDTHSAFASGVFTFPKSGVCSVNYTLAPAAIQAYYMRCVQAGSIARTMQAYTPNGSTGTLSEQIYGIAGDTLTLQALCGVSTATDANNVCRISFQIL